jgi:ATP synthase protein I
MKMAGNARNDKDRGSLPQDEAELSARLRRLGDELGGKRPRESFESDGGRRGADASGFARGFRLSTEFAAGVLVGAGIGWALDRLLGTSPFGLIVFLLLGFAAGVVNLVRAAATPPHADDRDETRGPPRPNG